MISLILGKMGFLHEHIILPLSDLAKGEQVHKYLRLLRQAEQWDETEIKAYQNRKIKELIAYVAKKVPFYQDWFDKNGVDPQSIQSVDALRQLPIVNKAMMRREGIGHFAACGFPVRKRMESRSSGSTGEPFFFYESKLSYSVNMAAKLCTWYKAGYRLGDCYMKIANGTRQGKMKVLQDRINHCAFVPFYSINDDTLADVLNRIEQSRPKFIRSYPIPLYLLAQYRNTHDGFSYSPSHVMTTGSTLPEAYRNEIERAFGCDVIDSYSCEGTPNTYETIQHDGYQVCHYYGIIEVLDEYDQPVANGIGRVVSTDLWNYAHPFLRYDTMDLVEVKNGKIVKIIGRSSDILSCDNGMVFTVHNFSHFFLHEVNSVEAYQIVKHDDKSITFRLVVNNQYNVDAERHVVDFWQQRLGMPVNIELVDEIPLMKNNKRLTIINETTE